uniref:TENA_THI-4 domain-containing protein n=1 Tax=Gongylonema pulchrum TaxID=637853 RepID=A0A183D0D5_9BILA
LARDTIGYMSLDGYKTVQTAQNHDVQGTEGIAVDWIHRNLYTLRQHQLHVQRLNGQYRTSLYKGLFRLPRALVAYPQTRDLFASDWSAEPFIVRLAMDGSKAEKLIVEELVWPNALAVDYFAERLYWADAFRDVIEFVGCRHNLS